MWREIYNFSLNPEVFLDRDNLALLLNEDAPELPGLSPENTLDALIDNVRVQMGVLEKTWQTRLADATSNEWRIEIERLLVGQSAPLAMSFGTCLQGLSAPAVFEDPAHLRAMALLADDVGAGQPEGGRADAYRVIARNFGLYALAGSPREIGYDRTVRDTMFRLPGLTYALSRRSDAFDCELVGFDLCLRAIGLIPALRVLEGRASSTYLSRLDLSKAQGKNALPVGVSLFSVSRDVADAFASDVGGARRVNNGFIRAAGLVADWNARLIELMEAMIQPRIAMAMLVQERAREAQVYHQEFKLENKPLSQWFREAQHDPLPLVDALSRSRLVRPSDPDRSLLVGRLLTSDGPMFRIFRDSDVAVIRRWIASLADTESSAAATSDTIAFPKALLTRPRRVTSGDQSVGVRPKSLREAYYQLQGRALPPQSRIFARHYCDFWLVHARASVDKTDRSLPQHWLPGALREWLLDAHDTHGIEFRAQRDGALPTREEVIDQTVQLAPLTLIDGAWLQGFTEVALASTRVGFPLFETYWDELGNGQWEINHPKIYRDVLAAMGVTLPRTGTIEFATDKRLREESFRLPVYWLSLGKFPNTFRPEILGMNLAMELSGVGGTYRIAQRFLQHYGFPTRFVDLHNTIDNVSNGHSAWAVDAIDAHIQATSDVIPIEATWGRIRCGYESLAPIIENPDELDFFGALEEVSAPLTEIGALSHQPVTA